jgi:hypothetical protein
LEIIGKLAQMRPAPVASIRPSIQLIHRGTLHYQPPNLPESDPNETLAAKSRSSQREDSSVIVQIHDKSQLETVSNAV